MSGYQDSNLGPPAPKAGALTGLRYIPQLFSSAKVLLILKYAILSEKNIFVSAETTLSKERQGKHIKTTKQLMGNKNMDEPCKGDTPA